MTNKIGESHLRSELRKNCKRKSLKEKLELSIYEEKNVKVKIIIISSLISGSYMSILFYNHLLCPLLILKMMFILMIIVIIIFIFYCCSCY